MGNSYSKLASLKDEDEKPRGAKRLASLTDEDDTQAVATDSPQEEKGWWARGIDELADPQAWKRDVQLLGRAAYSGVASLPTMAMDLGVGVRNLFPGQDYELPSHIQERALNEILPHAESRSEKVGSFLTSVLAGAKLPSPTIANAAPKGFVPPSTSPAAAVLQESQKAGYVVPPATASQSIAAKAVESIAGKASTAQAASIRNQQLTNDLARKAVGLGKDAPITLDSLKGVREAAGKVYAQIADAGEIVPDAKYIDDLAALGKSADEVAKAFPGANVGATKQIEEMVGSLLQNKFDSKAALQYLRELRKTASANLSGMNAADPAKQALGMAQREGAATLEDLIGRHLVKIGKPEVAESFGAARKLIAVTHSVEKALNESTGNVVAGKLGQQLSKGKPLSDELETIARFARAFPKAAKEVTESMPGSSPLDWATGAIASAASGSPLGLLTMGVRPGTRALALSDPVQRAISTVAKPYDPKTFMGLAPSAAMQAESAVNSND